MYPPFVCDRAAVSFERLTDDEKFAYASMLWRGVVRQLHYSQAARGPSGRAELLARRMFGCRISGYKLANHAETKRLPRCEHPLCPYCYAIRAGEAYTDLLRAHRARPDRAPFYLSKIQLDAVTKSEFLKKLRKFRPAGAVWFLHPLPDENYAGKNIDSAKWSVHAIVATDDYSKVRDRQWKTKIKSEFRIAKAVSNWMRYPWAWSGKSPIRNAIMMFRQFCSIEGTKHLRGAIGACRKDFQPGKGHYDFLGNDKLLLAGKL